MSVIKYLTPLTTSYLNKQYQLFGFTEEIDLTKFLPIRLTSIDVSIVNALRRIFNAEIPTFAFDLDNIKILSNNSQYHNQVLKERVSFITIDINDLKTYDFDDIIFAICDPQEPTQPLRNNTNNILMVDIYQHLYIQQTSTKLQIPTDQLLPYNSLLLTLNPGEQVHIIMKATSGIGRQHIRWQSGVTMYKFETQFDSTDQLETNEQLMNYIGYEQKQPKSIILTIESVGKLNSNSIVLRGIKILNKKLGKIKKSLLNYQNSNRISVEIDKNIPKLVKLKIINEDHTLGPVLEFACLNKLKELIEITVQSLERGMPTINSQLELLLQSLSAYRKPHPLDNYIELNIRTPQTYDLIFPKGVYDEVEDPSLRLVILAIEDIQELCSRLLEDAAILS